MTDLVDERPVLPQDASPQDASPQDASPQDASPQDALPRAAVAAVADNFVKLVRTHARVRAQMLAAAASDVEWSAHVLLRALDNDGPMRAGALAELVHSDPSTVSRQVAGLVRDGLLERRADPDDGRASLLALTDKAGDVLARQNEFRNDFFADILSDWAADDVAAFAEMLERFTDKYDHHNSTMIAERTAALGDRTGSTD